MLSTPHLLTGAAIVLTVPQPELSLPLAFLSHFVLDAIPHTEPGTFLSQTRTEPTVPSKIEMKWAALDFFVGFLILGFLFLRSKNPFLLYGGFLAVLPDFIDNVPYWHQLRERFVFRQIHWFHGRAHFSLEKKYWPWGVFTQLVLLLAAFLVIILKR
jgi:hypothetical protein